MSAANQAAAGNDPGGPPQGPLGPQGPSGDWLILQRLDDLRRAQDDLRRGQDDLRTDMKALDAKFDMKIDALEAKFDSKMDRHYATLDGKIDRLRTDQRWFIGVLCVAIIGLLAKLFFPAA